LTYFSSKFGSRFQGCSFIWATPYIYSKFGGEETKRDPEIELQKSEMETGQHMAMLFYIRASLVIGVPQEPYNELT